MHKNADLFYGMFGISVTRQGVLWTMSDMVKYRAAIWSFLNLTALYFTMSDIVHTAWNANDVMYLGCLPSILGNFRPNVSGGSPCSPQIPKIPQIVNKKPHEVSQIKVYPNAAVFTGGVFKDQ